jgi:hypothetical protein
LEADLQYVTGLSAQIRDRERILIQSLHCMTAYNELLWTGGGRERVNFLKKFGTKKKKKM